LSTVRAVIFGLGAGKAGNKIEDVKIKIVLSLGLALFAVCTKAMSYEVKVPMYDATAAVTAKKGNELLKKGDYEAARQYYDAAIRRDPKEWPAYFNRAEVFMHEGKWSLALKDFDTVLRLNRGMLLAAILRGVMNEQLGNYSLALADFDRIARITPLNVTAHPRVRVE
jgi:tetratricopeptide (TPR) repeat protein